MSDKIKIRRGEFADLPTLDEGELGLAQDVGSLYIGSTAGNVLLNPIKESADGYSIDGYLIPTTDNVHGLGTPDNRWHSLSVGPGSIHLISRLGEPAGSREWVIKIDDDGNLSIVSESGTVAYTIGTSLSTLVADGTAAAPAYSFIADTDTGIYRPTDNEIGFSVGGTETVRIDANGNLGIGTTSPAYTLEINDSGATVLNLHSTTSGQPSYIKVGYGATGNRNAYIDFVGDDTYTDYGFRLQRANSGANSTSYIIHRGVSDLRLRVVEAGFISFYTSDTIRSVIDSSGNFGIGTGSPGNRLDIQTGSTSNSAVHIGEVENEGIYITTINEFDHWWSGGAEYVSGSWYARSNSSASVRSNAGYLRFYAQDSLTDGNTFTPQQRMVISPSGNVGLGTSNTSLKLYIVDDIGSSANPTIRIDNNGTWTYISNNLTNGAYSYMTQAGDHGIIFSDGDLNSGNFIIAPWSDGTYNSGGLRITNDGYVGVGAAIPECRLHVNDKGTLGGTEDDVLPLMTVECSGSSMYNRTWIRRDADGNDWTTIRFHDAISVGASFGTPGTDTKCWIERDPNTGAFFFGNGADTILDFNSTTLYFQADTDALAWFGRMKFGYHGTSDTWAIGHFDRFTPTGYAIKQDELGQTFINAATGRNMALCTNNAICFYINGISGNLHANGLKQIQAADSGDGADHTSPGYAFDTDPNTGMFHANTDEIGFSTAGTERMRIDDIGDVGIGAVAAGERLNISADYDKQHWLKITNLNTLSTWASSANYDATRYIEITGGEEYSNYFQVGPGGVSIGATYNPPTYSKAGADSLYCEGRVGIGTSTPLAILNSYSTTAAQARFNGYATQGGANINAGEINIGYMDSGNGAKIQYDGAVTGDFIIENTFDNSVGDIRFRTRTNGTPVEGLTILGDGYIGIGSVTPLSKLHIYEPKQLGDTNGAFQILSTMQTNPGGGHTFWQREWIRRDANGSDWVYTRYHDALSIDSNNQIPGVDTLCWIERDAAGQDFYFGSGSTNYLYLGSSTMQYRPDIDVYAIIGRVKIGYNGTNADNLCIAHTDHFDATSYALKQDEYGYTVLNCEAGADLYLSRGGTPMLSLSTWGVGIGSTFADTTLHVWKANAGSVTGDANAPVHIENDTNCYIQFLSPSTSYSGLLFGDPGDVDVGRIKYYHGDNSMEFYTNGFLAIHIDSSRYVGVGTSNPGNRLDVVTGNTTNSAVHIGEYLDEGFYLTTISDGLGYISHGAEYVSGVWTARATAASVIELNNVTINFKLDSSLTDGNTFTPTTKATIDGDGGYTVNGAGRIKSSDGSSSIPSYIFSGSTGTGLYLPAANNMGVCTGGGERWRFNNAGDFVAQGAYQILADETYTPAAPPYSFDNDTNTGMYRQGSDYIGFSAGGNPIFGIDSSGYIIGFASATQIRWRDGSASSPAYTFSGETQMGMYRATTNAIGFSIATNEKLRLDTTGLTVVNEIYAQGSIDAGTSTTSDLFINTTTGQIGLNSSSINKKTNIVDVVNTDWLYDLRVVNFEYKDVPGLVRYGLIAEETDSIVPNNRQFVSYAADREEVDAYYIPVDGEYIVKHNNYYGDGYDQYIVVRDGYTPAGINFTQFVPVLIKETQNIHQTIYCDGYVDGYDIVLGDVVTLADDEQYTQTDSANQSCVFVASSDGIFGTEIQTYNIGKGYVYVEPSTVVSVGDKLVSSDTPGTAKIDNTETDFSNIIGYAWKNITTGAERELVPFKIK